MKRKTSIIVIIILLITQLTPIKVKSQENLLDSTKQKIPVDTNISQKDINIYLLKGYTARKQTKLLEREVLSYKKEISLLDKRDSLNSTRITALENININNIRKVKKLSKAVKYMVAVVFIETILYIKK